jgi:hypothetical protein
MRVAALHRPEPDDDPTSSGSTDMALPSSETGALAALLERGTPLKVRLLPSHVKGTTLERSATSHTMRLLAMLGTCGGVVLIPLLLLVTTRQNTPVAVDLSTTASPGSTRSIGLAAFTNVNCSRAVLPSPASGYAAEEKLSTLTVWHNTFLML